MRQLAKPLLTLMLMMIGGCGGGGDSGGTSAGNPAPTLPPVPALATSAQIEVSLGSTLQKPVFQCGTGTDSVSADATPGSVAVFESGPVRPIALSAEIGRAHV